jgi:hypothetical protein
VTPELEVPPELLELEVTPELPELEVTPELEPDPELDPEPLVGSGKTSPEQAADSKLTRASATGDLANRVRSIGTP